MANTASRKIAALARHDKIREKAASFGTRVTRPRFVADVMLGRLAKWLRIAGFDVLYSNTYTDDALIEISNREKRVLLSRDTRLLVRKPVREFIFVDREDIQGQLRLVFETINVSSLDALFTRCLLCNEILAETTPEFVRERIPEYVYRTQSRFKFCPACRKIFWAGTHRETVVNTLRKLLPQQGRKS